MVTEEPRENRVRVHRRAANLTQSELGERVGVSRQSVVSIEKGNYSPSVYLALRLAQVFDTDVETLFPLVDRGAVK